MDRKAKRAVAAVGEKPRVVFAVGDAEFGYTDGKIWRLVQRFQEQSGWKVEALTHDPEVGREGGKLGLQVRYVEVPSRSLTPLERVRAADTMIQKTSDLLIAGTTLPLWKILALDDFVGSLLLWGFEFPFPLEADLIVVPLMGVDNNSRGSSGLYTGLVAQARRQGIPVLGLEVSPLGNKNTLSHLPAHHYAVKSRWSRNFLLRHGLAQPSQVSVLRWEEAYLLWQGTDDYVEAYLEKETQMRQILKIPPDRFMVLIPHHVAFLWEVRKMLEALAQLPWPLSVVIRVNPKTTRRQFSEREIVLRAYEAELKALGHVVVDEQVGAGLLLQLADLVLAPAAGAITERAAFCGKPTLICQAMGEEGWQGEWVYWEPHPEQIPARIQTWWEHGLLGRSRLAHMAALLLGRPLCGEQLRKGAL